MSASRPQNRPDMAIDLTRWNRAGLRRFQYVDGDAAVWLEELRIALLGLYLRRRDPTLRTPESWRDLFSDPDLFEPRADPADENGRLARLATLRRETEAALAWQDLLPGFPDRAETAASRNRRLLEQYSIRSPDYGWEIMRAFARAAHVLLGHLDAYANEGYLRTATQWDNVRRLAATVNYQPTPPASATTTVALILDEAQGGATIERGFGMSYAPPEGGPPLIFETIAPVQAHPQLNAAHVENWNRELRPLDLRRPVEWIAPDKAPLAPGDLAVLTNETSGTAHVTALRSVRRDQAAGIATIELSLPPAEDFARGFEIVLRTEPAHVLTGLPATRAGRIAVAVANAARYQKGALVQIGSDDGELQVAKVLSIESGIITLSGTVAARSISIAPMAPYAVEKGSYVQSPEDQEIFFATASGVERRSANRSTPIAPNDTTIKSGIVTDDGTIRGAPIAYRVEATGGAAFGYVAVANEYETVDVIAEAPPVIIDEPAPDETVRFSGKPPKGMEAGDWFAARAGSTPKPLKVVGVRTTSDGFYIQFDAAPPGEPEDTEFHGPMRQALRPADHDRRHDDAVVGGEATLVDLTAEARALIKPGRVAIVDYERAGQRRVVQAPILRAIENDGRVTIALDTTETFSGWQAGWTVFRLNTVTVSHGETKGSRTLGSGDAERRRQAFALAVKEVSFIPSSAAEAGVVADIDVTVNGAIWGYRDLIDPTAEEAEAWSSALDEDDTLQILFRRRLPSGQNNVLVARHRIGTGAKGTGVPAFSFTKPAKKHRFVQAIVQPFATAGGADREPVASVRANAPARLAANGRAVALVDFERLCRRHASVWQARAKEVMAPGTMRRVRITVVPANGGTVEGTPLQATLIDFVRARALPGVAVELSSFEALPIRIQTKVLIDVARFDKDEVRSAAEAVLAQTLSLARRALGQPVYVAEVMAALETVDGVSSALVTTFEPKSGAPAPARVATIGGSITAIFPTDEQVAHLVVPADATVVAEAGS